MKKIMITFLAPLVLVANIMLPSATMAQQCNINHTSGINSRQYNQEVRIQQGIRSGELTRAEAAQLQKEQARVRFLEWRLRSDNHLTFAERARINQELNEASRNIYRLKHNGWERPWAR